MDSEQELIVQAQSGDDAAFTVLVKRYLPVVYGFVVRYTSDTTVAEDAAQDAFVKAWRHLKRFDSKQPLRPWLLRIARNAANDIVRKKRGIPFSRLLQGTNDDVGFEETIADDAPLPPELFEKKELGREVAAALEKLPERDRAVLLLRYEDELGFAEIGAVLAAPMNTVKSWHRRALARLRTLLESRAPKGDTDA